MVCAPVTLLSLEKCARQIGDLVIFEDVTLRVDDRDRVGIVGDNGSGKTTLLRVLVGIDPPDEGQRHVRRDLRIAYAAQIPELAPGTTVLDYVLRGDGSFDRLAERLRTLEAALAEHPGDERRLREYGHLQATLEAAGGYQRRHLCEKVLSGIGFAPADLGKDAGVLSGGEKSRLQLAALMVAPADLMVLDEPTNHLDLDGIAFLADYLVRHAGACVVVSHDRRFLDEVATSILDVDAGTAKRYSGNYSAYRKQRDEQLLAEARAFKNQQRWVEKEMEFIRRNMAGRMSVQAKGRLKRLARLERLSRPAGMGARMALRFREGRGLAGQAVLEAEDVGYALPNGRVLLRRATFRVNHGETLGILGRNGAGKTTLLRLLAGQLAPQRGEIRRAHGMREGYFSQEMSDLPAGGTVLAALQQLDPKMLEREAREHLARFLFRGDDVEKPVATLSGGERRRLCLARLTAAAYDFLCLDEPTNHLDITAREGLEEALQSYGGAAVLISHDRAFLQAVTDRVLYLEDGEVTVYDGGLDACLAKRAAEAAAQAAAAAPARATATRAPAPPSAAAPAGKIRNPLMFQKLEEEIMALEAELESVRVGIAEPATYRDPQALRAAQERQADLQQKLDAAYARWESW
jgi:ATP-binding cassette subfamily F protein 3